MKNVKVIAIDDNIIYFDNGLTLSSYHSIECCEYHYLSFGDLTIDDFESLEFDLTNDNFFNRIKDYGIELIPINGHSVKIPGYGYNNGWYSSKLELILTDNIDFEKIYDISDCQEIYEA